MPGILMLPKVWGREALMHDDLDANFAAVVTFAESCYVLADASSTNVLNQLVLRDAGGDFAARNITADTFVGRLIGSVTGNVKGDVVGNATGNVSGTATSLVGGSIGQIPYQSALNTTAFLAAGTAGYVLKCKGNAAPVWEDPANINFGNVTTSINGHLLTDIFEADKMTFKKTTAWGNLVRFLMSNWIPSPGASPDHYRQVIWVPELNKFVTVLADGTYQVKSGYDVTLWVFLSDAAAANDWTSICWSPALTLAVAVSQTGAGNRVMTSADLMTWASRVSAADNNWQSVCWSPELSLFVAVASSGTGNRVMTSPNGIDWTIRTSAADSDWKSVIWSKELGLFVAVASAGAGYRVMTSSNGINWAGRNAAAANNWVSVCWAKELGLLVAVANSGVGNQVMTSLDGVNWVSQTPAANKSWTSVCWSPQLRAFVAVASSSGVMYSVDGINWALASYPTIGDGWVSVCWSPERGQFFAVGPNAVWLSTLSAR